MPQLPQHILYLLSFGVSLVISLATIPQIIGMAGKRQLFDLPDNDRKLHTQTNTSNLGGIGIFFAYIITCSLVVTPAMFDKWHYVVAASLLFFLTGMMDDLVALSPMKKLIAQLVPTIIITVLADVRILYLPGFGELPYFISLAGTIFLYIFTINAYNLIDGIDMFAASTGVLYTAMLGAVLALTGNAGAACVAFSLAGATAGFLKYNITPARIFMGDTGSLLLGFTVNTFCVLFVNSYNSNTAITNYIHTSQAAMLFCVALLSIPVFDCIRVFFLRIRKGVSPFHGDRRHAHHYLIDMGLNASQATGVLLGANIVVLAVWYAVQDMQATIALAIIVCVAAIFFVSLYMLRKKNTKVLS
jgi:UDP-GlcNAc:undecaprenyl-phosphate/decaprenyl-phosphate GlcNAc-1-phosphate transferase